MKQAEIEIYKIGKPMAYSILWAWTSSRNLVIFFIEQQHTFTHLFNHVKVSHESGDASDSGLVF